MLILVAHASIFFVENFALLALAFLIQGIISSAVYHRKFSHKSWECENLTLRLFSVLGLLSLTGSPISRTLVHRNHHAYEDTEKDPHSPFHMPWYKIYFPMLFKRQPMSVFLVKDLIDDKFQVFLHTYYLRLILSMWICAFAADKQFFYTVSASSALLWFNIGVCNVFCHYPKLRDSSILGLLTFGEGYHRTHHEKPKLQRFGYLDISYLLIRMFKTK